MAELVRMKKNNSALGSRVLCNGGGPSKYRLTRIHVDNLEKKKAYASGDYYRQYYRDYSRQHYLLNKDKKSDYYKDFSRRKRTAIGSHNRSGDSMKAESRQEYKADYHDRHDETRANYRRQYDLQNNEMKAEYRNRYDDSRPRYQQQYSIQNKEKTMNYQQEYYNRNDDLIAKTRRLYFLGKKEYFRLRSGYQRINLSWRTPDIVRDYFDSIAKPLNISNIVDWYRISRRQMDQYGGLSLYDRFGNLGAALQFAYPEINWDLEGFSHRAKKSGQRWLKLKIRALLPGTEIIEDYQHPDLNWECDSERNMELDLWIPRHRVGIEYQGEQHYYNMNVFGPSNGSGAYSERDILKNNLCETRGITLIAIPYWWDGSVDSLSATLYRARPDVFPVSQGNPIPREKPEPSRRNNSHLLPDSCKVKSLE